MVGRAEGTRRRRLTGPLGLCLPWPCASCSVAWSCSQRYSTTANTTATHAFRLLPMAYSCASRSSNQDLLTVKCPSLSLTCERPTLFELLLILGLGVDTVVSWPLALASLVCIAPTPTARIMRTTPTSTLPTLDRRLAMATHLLTTPPSLRHYHNFVRGDWDRFRTSLAIDAEDDDDDKDHDKDEASSLYEHYDTQVEHSLRSGEETFEAAPGSTYDFQRAVTLLMLAQSTPGAPAAFVKLVARLKPDYAFSDVPLLHFLHVKNGIGLLQWFGEQQPQRMESRLFAKRLHSGDSLFMRAAGAGRGLMVRFLLAIGIGQEDMDTLDFYGASVRHLCTLSDGQHIQAAVAQGLRVHASYRGHYLAFVDDAVSVSFRLPVLHALILDYYGWPRMFPLPWPACVEAVWQTCVAEGLPPLL